MPGSVADHETLAVLLARTPDVAGTTEMAVAAPISTRDVEAVRLLREHGAERQMERHAPCLGARRERRAAPLEPGPRLGGHGPHADRRRRLADGVTLTPDDPKPPSEEVAQLLRNA